MVFVNNFDSAFKVLFIISDKLVEFFSLVVPVRPEALWEVGGPKEERVDYGLSPLFGVLDLVEKLVFPN
jgi:hypothetical protein